MVVCRRTHAQLRSVVITHASDATIASTAHVSTAPAVVPVGIQVHANASAAASRPVAGLGAATTIESIFPTHVDAQQAVSCVPAASYVAVLRSWVQTPAAIVAVAFVPPVVTAWVITLE